MKNIHLLETKDNSNILLCIESFCFHKGSEFEDKDTKGNLTIGLGEYANRKYYQPQYIYITSDEEIKEEHYYIHVSNDINGVEYKTINYCHKPHRKQDNEWYVDGMYSNQCKKIILTTDQDLIKDGVQAIDDEFLEWFIKNHSCDYINFISNINEKATKDYEIIIPKEEPNIVDKFKEYLEKTPKEQVQKDWDESCKQVEGIKGPTVDDFIEVQRRFNKQETLEEAAKTYCKNKYGEGYYPDVEKGIKFGANWQQERSYTLEQISDLFIPKNKNGYIDDYLNYKINLNGENPNQLKPTFKEWFEQFKKK